MKTIKITALATIMTLLLGSCGDGIDDINELVVPTNYEFVRDGASTVSFSGQTTRISMATELASAMQDFSTSQEALLEMYANQSATGAEVDPFSDASLNASTKSVRSKVAASRDFFSSNTVEAAEIKEDFESWIISQVTEVFPNREELATAGKAGQIADGSSVRYVNGKGLEYNQAVTKSLIGALIVDQMLNNYLSTAVLDEASNIEDNNNEVVASGKTYTNMEHKWDEAYGYIFGADGTDFTNPLATLGQDNFLNKYLSRVDNDADFAGIASEIYEALKLGRAAIVANDYDLRDEQISTLRANISKVVAVRAVYYLQQGKLAKERNDYGGAFHDFSEGFGFVYSLRFLRDAQSDEAYFSRSEVDSYLTQLTEGNGFWDVTSATLDSISEEIASRFDFTVKQAGS
jgi:hypothetical protein